MFKKIPTESLRCRIDLKAIDKAVKRQRETGKRFTLSDTECRGLRLVINPNAASWTYTYRKRGFLDGGKRHPQRAMKLGNLATIAPAAARYKAEQVKAAVRDGLDPAVEDRAERHQRELEAAKRTDLNALLDQYIALSLSAGTKHHKDEAAHCQKALSEMNIGHVEPSELTVKDLRRLLEIHRERPATARHRFGAMSRFLNYLVDEEFLPINPALSISQKRKPSPPAPRQRFYKEAEVGALWHSAIDLKPVYCNYLRFLIAVPLRSGETAELTWSQIDMDRMEIRLSAADTKNSTAFTMPITGLVKAILEDAEQAKTARVFQLSNMADAPMTAWTHFHDRVRAISGIGDFSRHDLRRTFSTLVGEHSDFNDDVIDSLLNHKQSATRSGVMRHYQNAKRLPKRREVMQAWADYLDHIIKANKA